MHRFKVYYLDRSDRVKSEKGQIAVMIVHEENGTSSHRNIWTIPRKMATPQLLQAISFAVSVGAELQSEITRMKVWDTRLLQDYTLPGSNLLGWDAELYTEDNRPRLGKNGER